MKKEPLIFLADIAQSIQIIESYVKDIDEDKFSNSLQVQDAVVRRIEIIGEAVKNLPLDFRNKYSDIPWKKIAGMRDVLIHEYFGVNLKRVWKIVKNDLPVFWKQILEIIEGLDGQKIIDLPRQS